MSFYDNLNSDQMTSFYSLVNFLQRLRVIGHLEAHTVQASNYSEPFGAGDVWDFATTELYAIEKDGYTPDKSNIDMIEKIEAVFGGRTGVKLRGT